VKRGNSRSQYILLGICRQGKKGKKKVWNEQKKLHRDKDNKRRVITTRLKGSESKFKEKVELGEKERPGRYSVLSPASF